MYYLLNSPDLWELGHKVTFDGEAKLITVNPGQTLIDVKVDVYSSWKEWSLLRDYTKFPLAMRAIGGDPIDALAGIYAGDIYFLINGWRMVIPHNVKLTGVLYSEDYDTPYIVQSGGGVIATVSNLVQTVVKEVAATYTPQQIAAQVRTELAPELNKINGQIDGLTPSQLIMLQEIYAIYGLDPTKPLIVSETQRTAGEGIVQNISSTSTSTTVHRQ